MSYYPLIPLRELHDGYKRAFSVAGRSLLLVQDEGRVFIIENRCPHMDAPLVTGLVDRGTIRCRAHGIAFSLETGKASGPLSDSLECLRQYEPVYDGAVVGVEL